MSGRPLSPERKRVRDTWRLFESEPYRNSVDADDFARRAGLPRMVCVMMTCRELNAGLETVAPIIRELASNGMLQADENELFAAAVRRSPYPMWTNKANDFETGIFVRLTFKRYVVLVIARKMEKQRHERRNKLSIVAEIASAAPVMDRALKAAGALKALKP